MRAWYFGNYAAINDTSLIIAANVAQTSFELTDNPSYR